MSDHSAPELLTAEQLIALLKIAVPCTSLSLTPSGDVLIVGRHSLGIDDVAIRVSPEDLVRTAGIITDQALAMIRARRVLPGAMKA